MVLKNLKRNMQLNSDRIIALRDVHTKAPLEPAGENQTHVDRIQS